MSYLSFPHNILEFQSQFVTEEACQKYLGLNRVRHEY